MKISILLVLLSSITPFATAFAAEGCFPENDLYLEDRLDRKDANLDKFEFNKIIDSVESYYKPVVAGHGGELLFKRNWSDHTVNAYANREGNTWVVAMFGGLARRPEVTADGFAMVVCHELGHQLGGFPFVSDWAADEGQADYFATQACAKNIWANDTDINSKFRQRAPKEIKLKCNEAYHSQAKQNLCYRTALAGKSLATLLAALSRNKVMPKITTPDETTVGTTNHQHPAAQCRLDTYFNGALCSKKFYDDTIPGLNAKKGLNSLEAEIEASKESCTAAAFDKMGVRPRCWYAPQLGLALEKNKTTIKEVEGNGNNDWEAGETFAVNLPLKNTLLKPIRGAKLAITSKQIKLDKSSSYSVIQPNKSRMLLDGIEVKIPESFKCGESLVLETSASYKGLTDTKKLKFKIGGYDDIVTKEIKRKKKIPDGDRNGLVQLVHTTSIKNTNRVTVTVDIDHPDADDLNIQIISPRSRYYTFIKRGSMTGKNIKATFDVDVKMERIQGSWKLRVIDWNKGSVGTINSWKLDFKQLNCN